MKRCIVVLMALLSLAVRAQDMTFALPEVAGTLRMGLLSEGDSYWLSECKVKKSGDEQCTLYTVTDKRMGKATVTIEVKALKDTKGYTLKVDSKGLAKGTKLIWAYGGLSCEQQMPEKNFTPEQCKDNVFSIEGRSMSVYYGTSRRLRMVTLLAPQSDIRLSDARKMETPLSMYESGKKTDAPAVCAMCDIAEGESLYFAAYKQNPKADYNCFMLPELHKTGSIVVHKDTKWMESTPN